MPGMPQGFAELLARKYDIMQQQADTQRLGITAAANLDNVKAGLLPNESRANVGLTQAQTGRTGAEQRNIEETTRFIGPLARSEIGYKSALGFAARAGGGLDIARTGSENIFSRGLRIGQGFSLSGGMSTPERLDYIRSRPISPY